MGGDAVTAIRKTPVVRDLQREAEAAQALRVALSRETDDEECIRDTIEGEVDLQTGIANVLALITDDEILLDGLKLKIGTAYAVLNDYRAPVPKTEGLQ